jgi:hypothetical protein
MFANIVIGLSGFVATLSLVDFFATDIQKRRLSDWVLSVWNWLDEIKKRTFVEWFKRPRPQKGFLVAVVGLTFAVSTVFQSKFFNLLGLYEGWFLIAAVVGCGSAVAFWVGRRLSKRISKAQTLQEVPYITKSFIRVPILLTLAITGLWLFDLSFVRWMPEYIVVAILFLSLIAFVSSITIGIFMIVLVFPFLLADMLASCLRTAEFVVRRVAEYPKGPILALSVLAGGVAAVLKLFE